jgi:hypothetical protein
MPLDATIVQPIPTADLGNTDVGNAVVEFLSIEHSPNYLPQVAADHESRIAFGEKKYGQRLKINNGRDAIMDSYQELLDFLSYSMQQYLEGDDAFLPLFYQVASIAEVVRRRASVAQVNRSSVQPEKSKPSLTFIPNAAAPFTTEERITQLAISLNQDPENAYAIPFSELEGNLLHQVPSHITATGSPVLVDIAGEALIEAPLGSEPVTELGERLASELDSFDSPTAADIVVSPYAHIPYQGSDGDASITPMLVDSEETMTKLEQEATGAHA